MGALKRNHYIDFVRGIAAISVIYIHTVWWSGTFYVPEFWRNMSLLFEVPLFFFLAGWSYGYTRNIRKYLKNIGRLQLQYMLFLGVFVTILIAMGSKGATVHNIIGWIFHYYTPTDELQVVVGSLWFVGVYIFASLAGVGLIKLLNPRQLALLLIPLALATLYFEAYPLNLHGALFYIFRPAYFVFYLFFYLLGYLMKDVYIKRWQWAVAGVIGISLLLFGVGRALGIDVFNMQLLKFPPTFAYLLWSLYGILLVVILKNKFEEMASNTISRLGTMAIYVFFAQGISSSLIFYYMNYIQLEYWWQKLVVIFSINVATTLILAMGLKGILGHVERIISTGIGVFYTQTLSWVRQRRLQTQIEASTPSK